MIGKQCWNSLVLAHFNHEMYHNILADDNLYGDEFALSDKISTGFKLKKGNKIYFLPSSYVDKLPIRVKSHKKIIDRTSVYYAVEDAAIVKLVGENVLDFRSLVDSFCNYDHTNPTHFLLYKIMSICAYVTRVNWRVATKAAFGKDSCCDALRDLSNNCARVDKASPAKLDFVLKFPFILCNEIASLKREDKEVFLQFGLSCGARQNKYTKPTRKSRGTKEIYDISRLSLCFTYNVASFYREKSLESFDDAFPEQFLDRFIPFKLDGFIKVGQFLRAGEFDITKEYETNKALYIKVLKQLYWLVDNPFKAKYEVSDEFKFGKGKYRWRSDFKLLCGFISVYSKDKKEYDGLCKQLYDAHIRYLNDEINQDDIFNEAMVEEVVK